MSLAATCSYTMFLKWLFSDMPDHDPARHKGCLDTLARCRCFLKASVWESRRAEGDLTTTDRGVCKLTSRITGNLFSLDPGLQNMGAGMPPSLLC